MKTNIILGIVCVLLVVGLVVTKHSASADLEAAAASLTDCSNRLDTVQGQLVARDGALLSVSNSLAAYVTAAETCSNQLVAAQGEVASQKDQIAELNRQVTAAGTENQGLTANLVAATNQLTALTANVALAEATAKQANLDLTDLRSQYGLLQNRFQRDVAERLVVERKFNNPEALQAQITKLKEYGGSFDVTADKIYAGLDVEVKSNGVAHVIAPN